jgi:hypothetical protein
VAVPQWHPNQIGPTKKPIYKKPVVPKPLSGLDTSFQDLLIAKLSNLLFPPPHGVTKFHYHNNKIT